MFSETDCLIHYILCNEHLSASEINDGIKEYQKRIQQGKISIWGIRI